MVELLPATKRSSALFVPSAHAGGGLLALLFAAAFLAPFPEDWDGVGFVLSLRGVDLEQFRPHFPGYPVYVQLSRSLRALVPSDALACSLTSAVGFALGTVALLLSSARSLSILRVVCLVLVVAASPLCALTATGVGSDALGLGLALLSLSLATQGSVLFSGVCAGLALGARPSNAVLFALAWLCFVPDTLSWRQRFWQIFSSILAFLFAFAPLLHRYGASFVTLGRTQVHGHFSQWGGTALSDASLLRRCARLLWLLWERGLGSGISALSVCVLVVLGVRASEARERRRALLFVLLASAYVVLLQNVEAPRHGLAVLCVALFFAARGVLVLLARGRVGTLLALGLLMPGVLGTTMQLRARRAQEPPGLELARWLYARDPTSVLFGTRSVRYGELVGLRVYPREWMGEVEVTLERLDRLPRAVYLTDEVKFRERASGQVTWVRTVCRDQRFERGSVCVGLYRWELGAPVAMEIQR